MTDNVHHPDHYTTGGIECIDAIKAILGPELFCGYLWGNAIKYLWRWPRKGLDEDLEKCKAYIARLQQEGYTVPAKFDVESGCWMPNPVFELMNCGIAMDAVSEPDGAHMRFA